MSLHYSSGYGGHCGKPGEAYLDKRPSVKPIKKISSGISSPLLLYQSSLLWIANISFNTQYCVLLFRDLKNLRSTFSSSSLEGNFSIKSCCRQCHYSDNAHDNRSSFAYYTKIVLSSKIMAIVFFAVLYKLVTALGTLFVIDNYLVTFIMLCNTVKQYQRNSLFRNFFK